MKKSISMAPWKRVLALSAVALIVSSTTIITAAYAGAPVAASAPAQTQADTDTDTDTESSANRM